MSNNNSTELLAWTREVAALRSIAARPIESDDDPRLEALNAEMAKHDLDRAGRSFAEWSEFTPEQLGRFYLSKCGAGMVPMPPIDPPAWGETRKLVFGQWPDVTVTDVGTLWPSGHTSAHLEREVTILADALPDDWAGGDDYRIPGDTQEETVVCVSSDLHEHDGGIPAIYVSVERAAELECVLGDVLHTLRRTV